MSNLPPQNADPDAAPSLPELEKASEDLKGRIEEAKKRNSMPLDSALGSPSFENAAADGRFDKPEHEDED